MSEDMIGDDVYELDMDRNVVHAPKTEGLKLSACTPLWYCVYKHRPSAMSVIHTHSMNAQLATLLDPTEESKTLKITHLEMLKGVGGHAFDDILEIPIIDNRPSEDLLAAQLEVALQQYPNVNCVLVRRHGLYVWGDSWEQAKTQAESFDYLFESAIAMKKLGIDASKIPPRGTYRTDYDDYHASSSSSSNNNNNGSNKRILSSKDKNGQHPKAKRSKIDDTGEGEGVITNTNGWNGVGDINNVNDMKSNMTPILPRDGYKHLLLDIEGCTTSISFVKDVLFPYVVDNIDGYIKKNVQSHEEQTTLLESLKCDLLKSEQQGTGNIDDDIMNDPALLVKYMVNNDLKVAALKSLQGKMWKDGYDNGTLKGHVYDDFVPMLEWMTSTSSNKNNTVKVYIYSSGSVQAQKLLFGNSICGDLTNYFSGHFDITTSGNKKEKDSYTNICNDLGIQPSQLVFCSDSEAELIAAKDAGIGSAVMTVRPGNAKISESFSHKQYPQVFSLLQLCG